jgi:hypothetical protein
MEGIETAAEYRSGGNTPDRIHSGSTWTSGTKGSRLAPIPTTTRSKGAANPSRGPSVAAAEITNSPMTTTINNPTMLPPSPGPGTGPGTPPQHQTTSAIVSPQLAIES